MNSKLLIYQKIYDMTLYGNERVTKFPKSEKFALAAEIKRSMYTLLRLTIIANKQINKKNTLFELDTELHVLMTFVRLAKDSGENYLSIKQYEIWSKKLEEIGRMLGGWIKQQK